jgi:hypothetical protein
VNTSAEEALEKDGMSIRNSDEKDNGVYTNSVSIVTFD